MQSPHGLKRVVVGRKFFFFGGDVYVIRPVTVMDVLGEAEGLPVCFLKMASYAGTAYEQAMGIAEPEKVTSEHGKNMVRAMRFFLGKGVLFKNGKPFDADKAMDDRATPENMKKMLSVFGEVLNISFKLFYKEVSITSININAIYILAKKYGCQPVDIVAKKLTYTDLDAWMFNMYVSAHGIKEEERQIKAQQRRSARGR